MANAKTVTIGSAGNDFYKTNGVDTRQFNSDPSLTRQEFAEECDINTIMKRYEGHNTGPNGLPNVGVPQYVDLSGMPTDLMGYMQLMQDAERAFMTLPAAVRREFDNDPIAFVDFASDPGNIDQMRAWDLAPPAKDPGPATGEPAVARSGPGPAELEAARALLAAAEGKAHGST